MLCLSGFELYSRWVPLTCVRMLFLQLISLLIKFVYHVGAPRDVPDATIDLTSEVENASESEISKD